MKKLFAKRITKGFYALLFSLFILGLYSCEGEKEKNSEATNPSKWYFYYLDEWNEMTQQSSNTFIYEEEWAFPWETEEGWAQYHVIVADNPYSPSTSYYFDNDKISGYEKVKNEDLVRFIFNATSHTLSVTLLSSGGGDGDNPGGGGGSEQTTTEFYIKHPWGTGEDADWVWKSMTKNGSKYTYSGLWGGVGANINTSADDSGAEWYPTSSISGASSCSIGDNVTFTFISSNGAKGSLSVSSNGGGGNPGGGGTTTSKPNTPTGVKATAGSSSISVTWNSVSGATSYNIYRSTSANGSYLYQTSVYSTSYTDYNVNAGTTYYYKVSAENSAGESSKSSYASAKIASSGGGDNPGGGGGGTTNYEPCPPSVTCSGSSSVTIKWTASTGYGCGTPTSYDVKRMNRITGQAETLKSGTTSTSYTDSQPFPGINTYGVTAINSYGSGSGTAISSAIGIAAPTFYDGISADSHVVYIDIKGLNVPEDWKPYYTLELYWSTSYSGYYTLQGSWKYNEYAVNLGNNNYCYTYDFGSSVDFSGKTYYYKLRWVFEAPYSPTRVEGSYTSIKSVTHHK